MSNVGYATLSVIPSMKGFGAKLSGGIGPEMDRAGKDGGRRFGAAMSSSAHSVGSKAGKLIGGGLLTGVGIAVAGVATVLKTGFGEALDASGGTAQLTAGIKSTGNAAGVSVKGLNDLAGSIQGMSGQTDDSIVASEKLLLTFTNIKNKGPDKIFDQATLASANMAAKMGGDASGSAIQLGKALNDPIKGISALSRVGVSFTAAQKKSVEAMVKHGNIAGAQKLILKELNTEFGGAAKAAGDSLPGKMEKAKRSFEDVSQAVAEGLIPVVLPALTKVGTFITTKVVPAIGLFVKGFKNGTGIGGKFKDAIVLIWNKVKPLATTLFHFYSTIIKGFIGGLKDGKGAGGGFVSMVKAIAGFIGDKLIPAITKVYQKVLPALMGLFKSVTQTMKDHQGVIDFIKTAFGVLADLVVNILLPALGNIVQFLLLVLGPAFRGIVTVVEKVVIPGIKILVTAVLTIIGGILKGVTLAFGWVPGLGPKLKAASSEFDKFRDRTNAALNGIKPPPPITVTIGWKTGAVPFLPGKGPAVPKDPFHVPAPGSGPKNQTPASMTINVAKVEAHDYSDFTKQMDTKQRQAALRFR